MSCNFYDILAVARDATVEEIKKAYKRAALTHHPDKGGDPEKFKDLAAAVETLTDERKRASYDSRLLACRSMDGRGGDRRSSSARPPAQPPQPPATSAPRASSSRPPRPPGGAVEIPADPSALSAKELKELLAALGVDHEGCLEKADLLEALRDHKEKRAGRESTPRGGGAAGAGPRQAGQDGSPGQTPRAGKEAGNQGPGGGSAKPAGGPQALRMKVVSLGSAAVGKSTLIKRYCEGRFVQKYIPTIGIDYGVKPVKAAGLDAKVNFFDTSGGEEFRDIRVEFYGDTSAVLLVYDVTTRSSFDELDQWIQEAKRHGCLLSKMHRNGGEMPPVALCANKVDLPRRVVSRPEGVEFAHRHGMHYYETSASNGDFVSDALNFLFERVVSHHIETRKRLAAG